MSPSPAYPGASDPFYPVLPAMTVSPTSDVNSAASTFAIPTVYTDLDLGSEIRINPDNLPPQIRAALESDDTSDLSPSEVEQILKCAEPQIPEDKMLVITKRVEEAERAVKWEQDAKAFLDHVMAMTNSLKAQANMPQ
ncbi:hypothetical protein BD311DRAFT_752221 [Dichomitus squalens]|uniref:Uncharacterized protein n=1 Tax=Dichomitus squalens TaxID=114155 RepID=A0A4Q9MW70_9APHY|nr:hypothetical protein BD311DRAFT_752221 [Dichomitus squalens]